MAGVQPSPRGRDARLGDNPKRTGGNPATFTRARANPDGGAASALASPSVCRDGWREILTAFGVATLIYAVAVRDPGPQATTLTAPAVNLAAMGVPTAMIPEEGLPQAVKQRDRQCASACTAQVGYRGPEKWSLARSADDADVLLTLETVDFNNGKIKLVWTVENRQPSTLFMPLSASNFELTDGTLQYSIDESQSQPAKLYIKPGAKETATLVVSQPVRPSALTLKVTVLRYPFGKVTWLVQILRVIGSRSAIDHSTTTPLPSRSHPTGRAIIRDGMRRGRSNTG